MRKKFLFLFTTITLLFSTSMVMAQPLLRGERPQIRDTGDDGGYLAKVLLLYRIDTAGLTEAERDLKIELVKNGQVLAEEVAHLQGIDGLTVIHSFSNSSRLLAKVLRDSVLEGSEVQARIYTGGTQVDMVDLGTLAKANWLNQSTQVLPGISSGEFWESSNAKILFGKTVDELAFDRTLENTLFYAPAEPLDQWASPSLTLTVTLDDRPFSVSRFTSYSDTFYFSLFGKNSDAIQTLSEFHRLGHPIQLTAKVGGVILETLSWSEFLDQNVRLAASRGWARPASQNPAQQAWSRHLGRQLASKSDPVQDCIDDCDWFEIQCMSSCSDEQCYIECGEAASDCAEECYLLEDHDSDGVLNGSDNCIYVYNPNQQDCDGDGIGTVCDPNDWYVISDSGWSSWQQYGIGYYCFTVYVFGFPYNYMNVDYCFRRTRTITEKNCYNNATNPVVYIETTKTRSCNLPRGSGCPVDINCSYGGGAACPPPN